MVAKKRPKVVDGVELWKCNKCEEYLSRVHFHKNSHAANGLQSRCKDCVNEANKEIYWNNREEVLKKDAAYREENREKFREYHRKYRKNNRPLIRDIARKGYYKYREKNLARNRKWEKNNKEHRKKYNAERRDKSRARVYAIVAHAVKTGVLIKPDRCSECNRYVVNPRNMLAHHHDYSKPLDVEWLCRRCHGRRHRIENSGDING